MRTQVTLTRLQLGATTLVLLGTFAVFAALAPAVQAQGALPAGGTGYTFERGFPVPETAQRVHGEEDFERAVQAYQFFYPTIWLEGMFQGTRDVGVQDTKGALLFPCGPKNVLFTANSDTPYMFSTLNLQQAGPTVIELPAGPLMGIVNDHNFRYIADIGLPGPDAGKGGKHLVLPPDYKGEVPAGYYTSRSATNLVFLGARAIPAGGDMRGALEVLRQIKVYPLSQSANPPALAFTDKTDHTRR
jgi:hypothetical protein